MQDHYNRGMFDKTKGYTGAVAIKCDEENNPEEQRVVRVLECDVTFKLVDIVETAYINVKSAQRTLTVTGN